MRKKWISGISAVCLILLLPFFNWIRVVNLVDLFSRIGVTKDMAADLLTGYNLYNLLSFVQYANQGVLGLFAMVLLILAAAAIYFNVAFIIRTIFGLKKGKGELGLLAAGKCAFLFQFLTALATIVFIVFSNSNFGTTGFVPGAAVIISLVISLLSYIYIKILEKRRGRNTENTDFWLNLKETGYCSSC